MKLIIQLIMKSDKLLNNDTIFIIATTTDTTTLGHYTGQPVLVGTVAPPVRSLLRAQIQPNNLVDAATQGISNGHRL